MTAASALKVTKTIHRTPYAAISPSRPELSQKGHVVLITGSSTGIGLAIARAFAQAGAATVILTGRREGPLSEAVKALEQEFSKTKFIGKPLDISNSSEVERFWVQIDADGVVVDVLVLNAARIQPRQASMVELGYKEIWPDFVTNVGANMDFADRFYHQNKRASDRKLSLVHVSTMAIHDFQVASKLPNYSASKNAGTLIMQQLARGVSSEDMQVVSFHPGAIFTDAAKGTGYTISDLEWDDENLPAQYAVWAASDEAKFLHGRFTWAAWDVEELKTGDIREKFDNDANYLRVGVVGL